MFDSQALLFVGICIGVAVWVYVSIRDEVKR